MKIRSKKKKMNAWEDMKEEKEKYLGSITDMTRLTSRVSLAASLNKHLCLTWGGKERKKQRL